MRRLQASINPKLGGEGSTSKCSRQVGRVGIEGRGKERERKRIRNKCRNPSRRKEEKKPRIRYKHSLQLTKTITCKAASDAEEFLPFRVPIASPPPPPPPMMGKEARLSRRQIGHFARGADRGCADAGAGTRGKAYGGAGLDCFGGAGP